MSVASGSAQLPLALRFASDQRFATFVSADAAVLPLLRGHAESAQPGSVLIVGGRGSGKTHLAIATCAHAQARGLTVAYLPLASAAGRLPEALQGLHDRAFIALDGMEATVGDQATETALFDFHNRALDVGRSLLYTASAQPDDLQLALPDLRSRLAQCQRIVLTSLDDAGRARMLQLRAQQHGLQLDAAAIDWLLRRVSRDPANLSAVFDQIDQAALAAQRRVTVPFLREIFGAAE